MSEQPTIDRIKAMTQERQIRALAGVIDEQNDKIANFDPDKLNQVSDDVDRLKSEVGIIKDKDTSQDASIASLVNGLSAEQSKTNKIVTDINTLNDTVDVVKADISNLEVNDNYLSDKVEVMDTHLTATEQAVATNQSDIATLKGSDASQNAKITAIQSKDAEQDTSIDNLVSGLAVANNEITGLSTSLISDVEMTDGTNAGSVQVTLVREDNQRITSANYLWGRDIGARLQAGTTPNTFKLMIDLSDGTVIESNEYLSSHEVVETDIYVTAITLVPDVANGQLGGTISYSNGTTQTINKVSVPTNPGVTSAIETLQTRMTEVESKNATQDTAITGLGTRLTTAEGKITTAQTDISNIKNKNIEQDGELTSLDARVNAIEDTPGIGKFTNSNLGTILGSTTDGFVSADAQGRGKVSGWDTVKDNANAGASALGNLSKLFIKKTDNVMKLYYYDAVTQTTTPINNIDGSDVITELSLAGNGNNGLQVKANGEVSNIATLVKTASLSKPNNNQMQVSVNGVTGTPQTIVNSVGASVDGNNLTVNVNGVSGTATLPAQSGGSISKCIDDYTWEQAVGSFSVGNIIGELRQITNYDVLAVVLSEDDVVPYYDNGVTLYNCQIIDLSPYKSENPGSNAPSSSNFKLIGENIIIGESGSQVEIYLINLAVCKDRGKINTVCLYLSSGGGFRGITATSSVSTTKQAYKISGESGIGIRLYWGKKKP